MGMVMVGTMVLLMATENGPKYVTNVALCGARVAGIR
jgi:hypothetical protein